MHAFFNGVLNVISSGSMACKIAFIACEWATIIIRLPKWVVAKSSKAAKQRATISSSRSIPSTLPSAINSLTAATGFPEASPKFRSTNRSSNKIDCNPAAFAISLAVSCALINGLLIMISHVSSCKAAALWLACFLPTSLSGISSRPWIISS